MVLHIFNACIEIEQLMRLDELGYSIRMKDDDAAWIKWCEEEEKYCCATGHAPTYTALFDSYPVADDDINFEDLSYEYPADANVRGNITNIMRPILETLQNYIDEHDSDECLDALWLEGLILDTDDWTISLELGS